MVGWLKTLTIFMAASLSGVVNANVGDTLLGFAAATILLILAWGLHDVWFRERA